MWMVCAGRLFYISTVPKELHTRATKYGVRILLLALAGVAKEGSLSYQY